MALSSRSCFIQILVSRGLLGSVFSSPFDCMPCQLGKQPALPFNNSESITSTTFDLIHSDVWGPSPIPTVGGQDILLFLSMIFSLRLNLFNEKSFRNFHNIS